MGRRNKILPESGAFELALLSNNSVENMCETLDISISSYYKLLRAYGKKNILKKPHTFKYKIKSSFFKKESEEMWYIVGYFLGDGFVQKNRAVFGCSSKDRHILEGILDRLGSTHKIGVSNRQPKTIAGNIVKGTVQPVYSFSIWDKEIYTDLISLGILPNKSTENLNYLISPQRFEKDFLRGFMDSDGCIYKSNGILYCNFLSSSTEQLVWIKKFLEKTLNIGKKISVRPKNNLFTLTYANKEALFLLNYLYYDNCTLFLERKRNKIKGF